MKISTYKKRRSKQLCGACGKIETGTKAVCPGCAVKYSMFKRRTDVGLCGACGKPSKKTNCKECVDKRTIWKRKKRDEHVAAGLCGDPSCTIIPTLGKILCEEHLDKKRAATKQKKIDGICYGCVRPSMYNNYCEECWFKHTSESNFGTVKYAGSLKYLIESQNYTCAYTGEKLIPGKNASIDHIFPKSRGGSDENTNLQWTTTLVNRVKYTLTHDEFIEFCKHIVTINEAKRGLHAVVA